MKKIKLLCLYILGFALSILPIMIYFIANFDKYITNSYDGVRLASGGIILSCILLLKITGKLKIPSAVSVFSIIFVLSYLLDSIIADMMIFSFLALIGELCDMCIGIFIKREKSKAQRQEIAQETANEVAKVLNTRV